MYLSAPDSELEINDLCLNLEGDTTGQITYRDKNDSTSIIHVVTSDLSFLNTDFTKVEIVIPFKRKRFIQA